LTWGGHPGYRHARVSHQGWAPGLLPAHPRRNLALGAFTHVTSAAVVRAGCSLALREPWSRAYLRAFRAEPALNQPICSSVMLWLQRIAIVLPPGLWMTTSTGLPGARLASPRMLTRSAWSTRS